MTEHSLGKLHADYLRFHPAQVATDDMDPVYPWLRVLADGWDLDAEERAWLVFSHVIWYHPGSTITGFRLVPDVTFLPDNAETLKSMGLLDLPCETERRSHRPKQPLINHLLDLREKLADGPWAWANKAIENSASPEEAWTDLNEALMTIRGNGRWASYKTAEMLQKVCDLPVVAADAGHRYSSGPRKGLEILEPKCPTGQGEAVVAELDMMTAMWADLLEEPDIARVETSLCDFNSMVKGRYYTGHDIDSMLHALHHDAVPEELRTWALEAREAVFRPELLGELGGWTGVRKDLNVLYRETGRLHYVD